MYSEQEIKDMPFQELHIRLSESKNLLNQLDINVKNGTNYCEDLRERVKAYEVQHKIFTKEYD